MSAKILAVTNRRLCKDDFLERLRLLAESPVDGIVLREKDLSEADYERLAADVLALCREKSMPCILLAYPSAALRLGCAAIHLPLPMLRASHGLASRFDTLGVSVHSPQEAVEAERLGATYVTAGHIFATDCKVGIPGRGIEFLHTVCRSVRIPVYAIGGITPRNLPRMLEAGAAGGCMMSSLMRCTDPTSFLTNSSFKK